MVENRLYFADFRDVDGMKFPFRIRRAVGADTVEETVFDRFRINPRIDARKFEVPK
jgi:predicted thioesterase